MLLSKLTGSLTSSTATEPDGILDALDYRHLDCSGTISVEVGSMWFTDASVVTGDQQLQAIGVGLRCCRPSALAYASNYRRVPRDIARVVSSHTSQARQSQSESQRREVDLEQACPIKCLFYSVYLSKHPLHVLGGPRSCPSTTMTNTGDIFSATYSNVGRRTWWCMCPC